MKQRTERLGSQRGIAVGAYRAASRLVDAPMSSPDIVRAMTGTNTPNRTKIATAYTALQMAIVQVEQANDLVKLKLQEYCELLDQEIERLKP